MCSQIWLDSSREYKLLKAFLSDTLLTYLDLNGSLDLIITLFSKSHFEPVKVKLKCTKMHTEIYHELCSMIVSHTQLRYVVLLLMCSNMLKF